MTIINVFPVDNRVGFLLVGLGDDNKIYIWKSKEAEWFLYSDENFKRSLW